MTVATGAVRDGAFVFGAGRVRQAGACVLVPNRRTPISGRPFLLELLHRSRMRQRGATPE